MTSTGNPPASPVRWAFVGTETTGCGASAQAWEVAVIARDPDGSTSPAYLGKIVTRWLPGAFSTHSLRHRCGSVAYAGTRDLRAVQELLGHASPATTAIYTRVPETWIRDAMLAAA